MHLGEKGMLQSLKTVFALPEEGSVDVSIVMPCLNEVQCLPHCIANAQDALSRIAVDHGLTGEIVVADNGSTDGSQSLALSLGARVVPVAEKGYGAALIGGCRGAYGRYILMGDCDGSYDFTDGVAMVGHLHEGSALCMGSRFDGGIAKGAMPWKNRYIGNPALTGILNLFFRAGINDAHCGLRAIRKEAFLRLRLSGSGMEFASEMVIKAALLRMPITQVPVKLLPDLRDRAPHLRPWRDGWRHLRYLMMLAPDWLFGLPALVTLLLGGVIFGAAGVEALQPNTFPALGSYWTILGAALLSVGHLLFLMTCTSQVHAFREGYRDPGGGSAFAARFVNLETMLITGSAFLTVGAIFLSQVYIDWADRDYQATQNIFAPMFGTLCLTLGMQTICGGFLMAIIGGNRAKFIAPQNVLPAPMRMAEVVDVGN